MPALAPAEGVTIRKVSVYQGVERVVMLDGAPQASDIPIVRGRDTLIRVFYDAPGAAGSTVTARLELNDEEPIDVSVDLDTSSIDGNLQTSANFFLDGDMVQDALSYRVSFLEPVADTTGAATDGSSFPAEGREELAVDASQQTFRVVLVPFQYNADGSGRVPDVSPESVERYRERFLGLFPVANVEVSVREPLPWNSTISPFGQGWTDALQSIGGLRVQETSSQDVYYYGIFNPMASLGQFCGGGGCILGLAPLNAEPETQGNEQLRFAIGVGYPETNVNTAAHELGHSHGRQHVECGPGVQDIDFNYPHAGETIGVWGYDIVNQEMKNPSMYSDIMGYCDTQWISDYNFISIFNRGRNVNQPSVEGDVREPYTIFSVNGEGLTERVGEWDMRPMLAAGTEIGVQTATGAETRRAFFFDYDHLPGGFLLVPDGASITGVHDVVRGYDVDWQQ